jgi:hypothetical protein
MTSVARRRALAIRFYALINFLATVNLAACSLSPQVQQNANDDEQVLDSFADQVLLRNVLRARDFEPVNLAQLSSINGNISATTGVSAAVPFSELRGSNTRSTVTPTASISSTPTFSTSALNTQGFTVTFVQPISPTYVLSKWQDLPSQMLLYLFVKSIQLPLAPDQADQNERNNKPGFKVYRNNPDNKEDFDNFAALANKVSADMRLKSINVLEPIGPSFNPVYRSQDAGPGGYSTFTSLNDGQLHIGNAGQLEADRIGYTKVRMYKEYQNQVMVCIDPTTVPADIREVQTAPTPKASKEELANSSSSHRLPWLKLDMQFTPGSGGAPSSSTGSAPIQSSAAGSIGATAGATMPAITAALQSNRISAVIPAESCNANQIVLSAVTEENFGRLSKEYAHIEWRSTAEVFQYIGAVLRNPARQPMWGADHAQFLFQVFPGFGQVNVTYNGHPWSVSAAYDAQSSVPLKDHSMQVLGILDELVNTANIGSNIPITSTLQVIP